MIRASTFYLVNVNPTFHFAESIEAYFSRNDCFPYDRAEIEGRGPETDASVGKLLTYPDKANPTQP